MCVCCRRQVLGGARRQALAARYPHPRRERQGGAAAQVRPQDHRAHAARGESPTC